MSAPGAVRVGVTAEVAGLVAGILDRLRAGEAAQVGELAVLREALRGGELDVVAHSYLDPADPASEGVELVAVPKRPPGAAAPPDQWSGSPASDALALEMATGSDAALRRRIAKLDHAPSRLTAEAERAVVTAFDDPAAGARVAARAMLADGLLFLTATRYAADGTAARTASHACYPEDAVDPAEELAGRVVAELREPPDDAA